MELKDYTEEQLRAELKRRYDEHQKERESIKRCRHCEYMQKRDYSTYLCMARTYTLTYSHPFRGESMSISNRKIGGVYASYSKVAVDYADALIEELKKK